MNRLLLMATAIGAMWFLACGLSTEGTGVDVAGDAGALTSDAGSGLTPAPDAAPPADAAPLTPPSGLLFYYPFNGDTKDHSGNAHDLTNSGATPVADRNGVANAAYSFDGNKNYMVAPNAGLPTGNAPRTVTMWLDMADQHAQWAIVQFGTGDCTAREFGVGYQGSTSFWSGCNDVQSGMKFLTGKWTFIAVVFTPPTTLKIWTDTAVKTATVGTKLDTGAGQLFVGAETTQNDVNMFRNHYKGAIDELRIYDHALTDAEVQTVHALP